MNMEKVSAAGILLIPYIVFIIVLELVSGFNASQMSASDPLIQAAHAWAGLWVVPVISLLAVAVLVKIKPPSRNVLAKQAAWAGLGILMVSSLFLAMYALGVRSLPGFIPPEESAKPGMLLGMGAGVFEEVLIRLAVVPAAYFGAVRLLGEDRKKVAMAAAIVLSGLAFTLSHEIGPGAQGAFNLQYFITRFIGPGCIMSVLFFRPGPSFIIILHCTAHIFIPLIIKT